MSRELHTKKDKLIILKVCYILLILIVTVGLTCELYFVVERYLSVKRVDEYKLTIDGIYLGQKPNVTFTGKIWEKQFEKYKPNALWTALVGNERYTVKINSHGFRTNEFDAVKPDGVYRIICIGGSTTFDGKTNDKTYPAILERKLKHAYPHLNIEVLNFGISGTMTDYWINRVDDLFKFQPDMIIQYNAVNDISWYHMYRQYNCINKLKYYFRRTLNLSFVIQKLFPTDTSFLDNCLKNTFHNFDVISSEARSRGVEYIVGSFATPDFNRASDIHRQYLNAIVQREWGYGLRLKYYSSYNKYFKRYNRQFRSYVAQNNLSAVFVDEAITDPDLFTDGCHLKPEGIEKLANTFFDGVIKKLNKELSLKN